MQDYVAVPRHHFRWPIREASVLVPLIVAGAATGGQSIEEFVLWTSLGLGLAVLWFAVLEFVIRRSWFKCSPVDGLVYCGGLRERVIARSDVGIQVVRVPRAEGERWWQIWTGPEGAVILNEEGWGKDVLLGLAAASDAKVSEESQGLTLRELAERYPDLMPWFARHMVALAIALSMAGVLAVLAAVFFGPNP